MNNFPAIFLLVASAALGAPLAAEEQPIELGAYRIPGLVDPGNTTINNGMFYNLADAIIGRTEFKIDQQIYPPKRLEVMFNNGEIIGFYPATDTMIKRFKNKACLVALSAEKRDYIFYLTTLPFNSMEDLEGKRVGIVRGQPIAPGALPWEKISVTYSGDQIANMRLLLSHRVDYVVVGEFSGLNAIRQLGAKNVRYDDKIKLGTQSARFAFQDSKVGRKLCAEFKTHMQEFKVQERWNLDMKIARLKKELGQ